ncbi:CsbD family protein [Dactylosporangium cerinum]|uniref:CsbD family protein n=1 Tax=Dactylosporangium cerinum TaxID=1434730 RepID=A0ABV9VKK6_9ACTN
MQWAYVVIFVLLVLDCLLPVLPAETSVIAGGALAAGGQLQLPVVLVATVTAVAAGDLLTHEAARRGGRRLFGRWTCKGRSRRALAKTTTALHRWGGGIVAAGRFVPMGRTTVALVTGYARFPRRRFLPALLLGAVLWSCYMVSLGYLGGRVFDQPYAAAGVGSVVSLAVTAVFAVWQVRAPRSAGQDRTEGSAMSFTDKVEHKAEELKGAAKEKFGDATDNERLQAEGAAERAAAKAKQAGDHVKDAGADVKDAFTN